MEYELLNMTAQPQQPQTYDKTAIEFERGGKRYSARKYKLDLVEKLARAAPGQHTPKALDFLVSQRAAPKKLKSIGVNTLNAYLECHPNGQALVREGLIASPGGRRIAGWQKLAGAPTPRPAPNNAVFAFTASVSAVQIHNPQLLAEHQMVQQAIATLFQRSSLTPGSAFHRMREIAESIDNVYQNLDQRDVLIEDLKEDMKEDRDTIRALSDAAKVMQENLANYAEREKVLLERRTELESELQTAQATISKILLNPRLSEILAGDPA